MNIYNAIYQQAQDKPPFMLRFITGDESWVYSYDSEIKHSLCSGRAAVSKTEEGASG